MKGAIASRQLKILSLQNLSRITGFVAGSGLQEGGKELEVLKNKPLFSGVKYDINFTWTCTRYLLLSPKTQKMSLLNFNSARKFTNKSSTRTVSENVADV